MRQSNVNFRWIVFSVVACCLSSPLLAYDPMTPPAWTNDPAAVRILHLFPDDDPTPAPDESVAPFGVPLTDITVEAMGSGWRDPETDLFYGEPGNGAWELGKGPVGNIRVTLPVGDLAGKSGFSGYQVSLKVNTVCNIALNTYPTLSEAVHTLAELAYADSLAYDYGMFDVWYNRTWTARIDNVMTNEITLVLAGDSESGSALDVVEIYALAELVVPDATSAGTPSAWFDAFDLQPDAGDVWDDVDGYDSDGDGMLNGEEYVAGTDPTNPESVFKITASGFTGNGMPMIAWLGGTSGATPPYIIQRCADLSGSNWIDEAECARIAGTNSWEGTENPHASSRFYRVLAPRE